MKKFFITLIVALTCCVSSWAYTLDSSTQFTGDGIVLRMNSDGSCTLDSRETESLRGTYDITSTREVEPGCSQVDVRFNFNGETVYGQLFWPTQNGLMINFDNIILERGY